MTKVIAKSLTEISKIIDGEIYNAGNENLTIDNLAISPEMSCDKDLVLVFDEKYLKDLGNIKAKAMVLPASFKEKAKSMHLPVILVTRPRLILKKLLDFYNKGVLPAKITHPSAVIDPTSKIGKNCSVGAGVCIGANAIIGDNCVLKPNCTILDGSIIGNNVIIHSGAVIGSDGYGYVTEEESNLEKAKRRDFNFNLGRQIQHKILSIGNVIIEDDVEIGANTCVDRGTIGPTIIGAGTKVDNLVQIAHNCKIGKDCLIVGQVGLAGSVSVGDRVVVGGQCGFADNINIGDDVICVARAGVHGDIPSKSVYMGAPAVPYIEYFKNEKEIRRLPRKQEKLEEQVKALENKIKELEERLRVGV